jgi:hypothetical protein
MLPALAYYAEGARVRRHVQPLVGWKHSLWTYDQAWGKVYRI